MGKFSRGAGLVAVTTCAALVARGHTPKGRSMRNLQTALESAWKHVERRVPSPELTDHEDVHANLMGCARVVDVTALSPEASEPRTHAMYAVDVVMRWFLSGQARALVWESHPAVALVHSPKKQIIAIRSGCKRGTCRRVSRDGALEIAKLLVNKRVTTCNVFKTLPS